MLHAGKKWDEMDSNRKEIWALRVVQVCLAWLQRKFEILGDESKYREIVTSDFASGDLSLVPPSLTGTEFKEDDVKS